MAEEQQTETTNSPMVDDRVIQELEKITELEKKQESLSTSNESIRQDVAELKEKSENKDDKKDKNVIEDKELLPTLKSIEKKRYQVIGEEFMKGASVIFDEIKKAEELKQKMSTKNDKQEELKKAEDVAKKEKPKKKVSKFVMLGLAIAAVAGVLYTFRDKFSKLFENSDGIGAQISKVFAGVSSLGDSLLDSVMDVVGKIIGGFFGEGNSKLYDLIDRFFTKTLPTSIKNAGLQVISIFSEDANKSLMSQTDDALETTKVALEEEGETYDPAAAQQKFISALQDAKTFNHVKKEAALASLNDETKKLLLPLFNQQLLIGAKDENEKKARVYQGAESAFTIMMIQQLAQAENFKMLEALRAGQANSGLSQQQFEEYKQQFVNIVASSLGQGHIDMTTAEGQMYYNQVSNTLFSGEYGNGLESLYQTISEYQKNIEMSRKHVAASQAQSKLFDEAVNDEVSKHLGKQVDTEVVVKMDDEKTKEVVVGDELKDEVKKFGNLLTEMVGMQTGMLTVLLDASSKFIGDFLEKSFGTVVSLLKGIVKTVPFLNQGEMKFLFQSPETKIQGSNSYDSTSTDVHGNAKTVTETVSGSSALNVLQSNNRPLVIVSLSLDGTVLAKIADLKDVQDKTIKVVSATNEKMSKFLSYLGGLRQGVFGSARNSSAGSTTNIGERTNDNWATNDDMIKLSNELIVVKKDIGSIGGKVEHIYSQFSNNLKEPSAQEEIQLSF